MSTAFFKNIPRFDQVWAQVPALAHDQHRVWLAWRQLLELLESVDSVLDITDYINECKSHMKTCARTDPMRLVFMAALLIERKCVGDSSYARLCLTRALELAPGVALFYIEMARLEILERRYPQASEWLDIARSIVESPEVLTLQARLSLESPGALKLIDRALELAADDQCAYHYILRSHCLRANGRIAEANKAIAYALELNPTNKSVLTIALVHYTEVRITQPYSFMKILKDYIFAHACSTNFMLWYYLGGFYHAFAKLNEAHCYYAMALKNFKQRECAERLTMMRTPVAADVTELLQMLYGRSECRTVVKSQSDRYLAIEQAHERNHALRMRYLNVDRDHHLRATISGVTAMQRGFESVADVHKCLASIADVVPYEVFALDGWPARINYILAAISKQQGRMLAAENYFYDAIILLPNNYRYYVGLGVLMKEQRRSLLAEFCFRRAIQLMPNFPRLYLLLGNVVIQTADRTAEGLQYLRKAHELDPIHPKYADTLLQAMARTQSLTAALEMRRVAQAWCATVHPSNTDYEQLIERVVRLYANTSEMLTYPPYVREQRLKISDIAKLALENAENSVIAARAHCERVRKLREKKILFETNRFGRLLLASPTSTSALTPRKRSILMATLNVMATNFNTLDIKCLNMVVERAQDRTTLFQLSIPHQHQSMRTKLDSSGHISSKRAREALVASENANVRTSLLQTCAQQMTCIKESCAKRQRV